MDNIFDEMRQAVARAKAAKSACESNANAMVDLLDGNLKSVAGWRLVKLKKELRDFNIQTHKWKEHQ